MSDKSPCYGNGNGCPDRTITCHATCERYATWSDKQRSKPKGPPQGEIDADAVLTSRRKRQIQYSHEKSDERRRNR
jgi:hypothetical protein